MTNLLVAAVLALILGAAILYIYRAKKRGVKCIGCPSGQACASAQGGCSGGCSGCSGSCPHAGK